MYYLILTAFSNPFFTTEEVLPHREDRGESGAQSLYSDLRQRSAHER